MRFLRTNTACRISVGPFFDKTDGVTPETALTVTACKLTFMVDDGNVPTLVLDTNPTASGGSNDMVHVTGDDAGFYDLELAAANVNYVGRAMLALTDAATHCPVFHEFMILPAVVYDAMVLGTDNLQVDTVQVTGTAQTARDLGASVLLSSGTGTGQISLAAGLVTLAGVTHTGAVIPTVTTTTTATNVTTVNGLAAGVITAASIAADAITDAKVASDVTIASVTGAVGSVTGAVGSISGVTFPTNFSDLSISVTTGLVDITQTAADKAWSTTTRRLSDGTNIVLAKGVGVTGFNDIAATDIVSAGAITTSAGAVSTVTTVGTLTTYTGNTPQTSDHTANIAAILVDTAEIGPAGAGLTALASAANLATANTALAKLDDTVEDNAGTFRFTTASLVNAPSSSGLDAAATRAALGMSSANLDSQLSAIVTDTNELQTDWVNGGRLDLILDARSSQVSVDDLPTNTELATALGTADDAVLAAIAALNDITVGEVRTELATELARIDVATSTRATPAQVATELGTYDAPTNAEMVAAFTEIKGATWSSTDTLEAIRDHSAVTVTPISTVIESRVESAQIEAYFGENGWTIGPVVVTDSDGEAVSLAAYDGLLRFTVETTAGVDVYTTTSVTISGTDSNQWSVTGNSAITTTAPNVLRWSLRAIDTGLNVVLGRGPLKVITAANQDA